MQSAEVQIVAAAVTGHLGIADEARRGRRQLVDSPVGETRLDEPPDEVATIDGSRGPRAAAAGQVHPPAGFVDDVLHAGLLETPAGREPGLPGANNCDVNAFSHPAENGSRRLTDQVA